MHSPSSCAAILCGGLLLAAAPGPAAAGPVSGPIEIGPSWGQADPQRSAAVLDARLINHGDTPDRLIRIDCPASGHVTLRNGTLHQDVQAPNLSQQQQAQAQAQALGPQNGLDLPPGQHGAGHPVTAVFDLTQAIQPLTDGAEVPCTIGFAHGGERIVIFTIGETPQPTAEP